MKVKDATVSKCLRCFHTDLAVALGIDASLVFERLRYLFEYEGNGKMLRGHRWLFNTYDQWHMNHFPWLSKRNIQRAFLLLEEKGLIESIQPDGSLRRKYYRIKDGADEVELSHGAKLAPSKVPDRHVPNTGIDVAGTNLSKESSNHSASSVDLMESPEPREAENLSTSSLPRRSRNPETPLYPRSPLKPKPTREQVNDFIQNHCPRMADHRPDFFNETDWSKVTYWKRYIEKLEAKMEATFAKPKK